MSKRITDLICDVAQRTIGRKQNKTKGRRKLPREIVEAIKERKYHCKEYAKILKNSTNEAAKRLAWEKYQESKYIAAMKKASFKKGIDKRTLERIVNAGKNSSKLFWKETSKNTHRPQISEILVNNVFITEKEAIAEEIENILV